MWDLRGWSVASRCTMYGVDKFCASTLVPSSDKQCQCLSGERCFLPWRRECTFGRTDHKCHLHIYFTSSHLHVITSSPGKAPAISLKFLIRMKLSLSKIDSDYTTQHRYEWNFYKILWGCSLLVPILLLSQGGSWTDVYAHSNDTMVWPCILTKLCDVWGTLTPEHPIRLVQISP